MQSGCRTVSLDFHCADSVVFELLTTPKSYRTWYGFPQPLDLTDAQPDISLGAKLTFRGDTRTRVVTAFEPLRKLSISAAETCDEFTLRPTDAGCRVSLVTLLRGPFGWNGTEEARARANEEILAQLKKAAYVRDSEITDYAPHLLQSADARKKRFSDLLSSLFQGYKSPTARLLPQREAGAAPLPDNTEAEVRLSLRACLAALILCLLLIATLSVSLRFERSDVVPSSGLSVLESDNIDKQHAVEIAIGQSKTSLELTLSCLGYRISPDEYRYVCAERDENGEPLREIYVVYDAYAKVRRYAFVDRAQSLLPYEGGVRALEDYLSPSMNALETDEAVGAPCSAFCVDKSGAAVYYYGELDLSRDIFSSDLKSTLVVRLNSATMLTDALYYAPFRADDPYELEELTRALRRQYSSLSVFLADKLSFERLELLPGLTAAQAGTLLAAEPVNGAGQHSPLIYEKSVTISDETAVRYRYTVHLKDGVCDGAEFVNLFLEQRSNMLTDYDAYDLYAGMAAREVCAALGVLPSAAEIKNGAVTLCFGKRIAFYATARRNYELVIVFDGETSKAQNIYVNYGE